MNSQTDIIKDKLNILDIVGEYVKLERAGKNYKGKSPFTNEKTPSFFVSPEKGFFYCFSSGKGGDIFTFIQEIERVEFPEALKILADRAGVSIEYTEKSKEEQSERTRLFELIDLASKWYEVQLRKNKDVVDYLLDRGLKKETIVKFRIGYAKDSWRDIYGYLKSKKFKDIEIEKAGLAITKDGSGYYDRFRSRIMFPLFDGRGRIVGFSGRIFGKDDKSAKYINSPEGQLFDKSKVLYGYHIAKSVMSKLGYCILVEGQFDVILSQQSGYENTVAISGTGLTDEHIKMIKRFTNDIFFVLDSDNAGIKATTKNVLLLTQNLFNVKVIILPKGQDPADVIKTSKEKWDIAIKEATDYLDYRIKIFLQNNDQDNISIRDSFKSELYDYVCSIEDNIKKWRASEKIAIFMHVPVDVIQNDIKKYIPNTTRKIVFSREKENKNGRVMNDEFKDVKKELLVLINFIEESFSDEFFDKKDFINKRYYEIFQEKISDGLSSISKEEIAMSMFVIDEKMFDKDFNYFISSIISILNKLEIESLEKKSKEIEEKIRKEQIINPSRIPKELMKKSSDIRKKIDSIRNIIN